MRFTVNFGGFGPEGNPFGGGFGGGQGNGDNQPIFVPPQKPRKPRKPVGNAVTQTVINLVVTALLGCLYFYIYLPPMNIQSEDFWFFLFVLCVVYCLCAAFTSGFQSEGLISYWHFLRGQCKIPAVLMLAITLVSIVGSLTSWVVFRAGSYSKLLPLETGDFAAEVDEIRYDQIPMLDGDSAAMLGNRKLGELADMVSQFEILPIYDADGALNTTQINYQGRPVRVTSLAYGDIIKWFNNRAKGLPAYIIIDMVTREAEVIRLESGMRYTVAEHFGRYLLRHLRFHYPAMMFDTPVFEIDESGTPYWVCPRIIKTIGLFGGIDVHGAVLVNAVTGESEYVEEVPSWVDRLYSADIIIRQYDYYGRYHNGFINSILGQRDVTVTTDGYNYIAIDDDVYMYTGVTSVTSDESNIGFILTNQRTKATRFYSIAGAEEYSAMDSAESQVQQMRYRATFPLLLNIAGQPSYFMALKGADRLVKMYAMVNVQQYDIVSTGATVAECEDNYRNTLRNRGLIDAADMIPADDEENHNLYRSEGIVREIRTAVVNGNTHFYISIGGSGAYLDFNAADNPNVILLDVGDRVLFSSTLEDISLDSRVLVPAQLESIVSSNAARESMSADENAD